MGELARGSYSKRVVDVAESIVPRATQLGKRWMALDHDARLDGIDDLRRRLDLLAAATTADFISPRGPQIELRDA